MGKFIRCASDIVTAESWQSAACIGNDRTTVQVNVQLTDCARNQAGMNSASWFSLMNHCTVITVINEANQKGRFLGQRECTVTQLCTVDLNITKFEKQWAQVAVLSEAQHDVGEEVRDSGVGRKKRISKGTNKRRKLDRKEIKLVSDITWYMQSSRPYYICIVHTSVSTKESVTTEWQVIRLWIWWYEKKNWK